MYITHSLCIVIVLISCEVLLGAKDYYEVLGVKRDATEKQIKRRFRELGTNSFFFFK